MSYQVRTEKRRFLLMNDGFRGADRFVGVVEFKPRGKDADKAVETKPYQKESLAKAQATRLCKSYQSYFDREGERWEVLQRQKREAQAERERIVRVTARIEKDFRSLDCVEQMDIIAKLQRISPQEH